MRPRIPRPGAANPDVSPFVYWRAAAFVTYAYRNSTWSQAQVDLRVCPTPFPGC
jgi:hypothetical protein